MGTQGLMVDRRKFLQGGIASAVAAALPIGALARMGRGGVSASGASGFYPAGHWFINQPMIQVYPESDSVTPTWARHHYAYWDGTNDIEYNIPIGVAFGAYPYVYELISGPPGMYIAEPIYNGFQNPNYGRLIWHPQGNISEAWNGTVEIQITDQQKNVLTLSWALQTSSSQFIFIDSATGNDSNSGTYAEPYASITGAFGATYSTTKNANKLAYIATGSGDYTFPYYSDNPYVGADLFFGFNSAAKPAALMALPGNTPVFDMTATVSGSAYGTVSAGNDMFFQGFALSGYSTKASNVRGFWYNNSRVTFDGISWDGPGYGGGGDNDTMIYADAGSTAPANLFITDCSETNRESSIENTNYAICTLYSQTDVLVQRCSSVSSGDVEAVVYAKSDCQNTCLRENYGNHVSANHAFDFGQAPNQGMLTCESIYNLGINVNAIFLPQTGQYSYGSIWAQRNTIIGAKGLATNESAYNIVGPQQNAAVAGSSGTLAAGTYYYVITALGVSGETTPTWEGGSSNQQSATTTGTTGSVALSWVANPFASGYNIYRGTTSGSGWEFLATISSGSTTTYTDTGSATTATTPPTTNTALSSARFAFNSNAVATTNTPVPPTGAAISSDGLNVVDSSGTGEIVLSNGTLNPAYSGYSSIAGEVGYQIM